METSSKRNTRECITCPSLGRDSENDRPAPNLYEHRWCCDDCRAQLPGLLIQIPRDHTELDPTPGTTHNERVSGSAEAPLGVRASVLDHLYRGPALANPALPWGADQEGDLPAARTLYQIALAWLPHRPAHLQETLPNPEVPDLAKWLHYRTEWACSHDDRTGTACTGDNLTNLLPYHAQAINDLAHHLRLYTQGAPDKPEPIKGIECRECSCYTLARHRGDVICTSCGDRMGPDEYERWTGLLAEHEKQMQHQRAA